MTITNQPRFSRESILAQIDAEIAILQKARLLISGGKVRNFSPEGRQRISQAVSLRWQQYRKAQKSKHHSS